LLADVKDGENATIELIPGQRVAIYPMCAHKFEAITVTQVIEYYSKPFDLTDDNRFEGFEGEI